MPGITSKEIPDKYNKSIFIILLISLLSLSFSVRFLNSIMIGVMFLMVFVSSDRKLILKKAIQDPYIVFFILLFLLQLVGLLYTEDISNGWKEVTRKASFIAIPLFFCCFDLIKSKDAYKLLLYFSISLVLTSLFCIIIAFITYYRTRDISVFFYHKLVEPANHHAVLFSFFILFCMIYWLEAGIKQTISKRNKRAIVSMVIFFMIMIFLLSSKLTIVLAILICLYYLISSIAKYKTHNLTFIFIGSLLAIIITIVSTDNIIKQRFENLVSGNSKLYSQKSFDAGTSFNGLQFRLLTWRFTYEILSEKKTWIMGVSPGDAQHELNDKYLKTGMYLGDGKKDTGFLNFNCHNLFLQIMLESGILGVIILFGIIFSFFVLIVKYRSRYALIYFLSILAFCMSESMLSAHYTILLFIFFPLLSLKIDTGNSIFLLDRRQVTSI
jgi:O-antigen ligase